MTKPWLKRRWQTSIVAARYILLFAVATAVILVPLWTTLVNSLKSEADAASLGLGLPAHWEFAQNYLTVLQQGNVIRGSLNTVLILVPTEDGVIILGSLAAWIFARERSAIVSSLYAVLISGIIIPPAIVTTIRLLKFLDVYGSRVGIILFYMGFLMSFAIFLITGFVKTIPLELEEAARIDGAGSIKVFSRIILPLLTPVIFTCTFILLLLIWDDFLYPYFFLNGEDQRTLTLSLFNFVSPSLYEIKWNLVFADVVITSLPLLGLYYLGQRWLVSGLMGVWSK